METLNQWVRTRPEFAAAWAEAKTIIQDQLCDGAQSGALAQASAIFELKVRHGWVEPVATLPITLQVTAIDALSALMRRQPNAALTASATNGDGLTSGNGHE